MAMADPIDDRSAVHRAAVALLLLGVALHYGWAWFPVGMQSQAWRAMGAIVRIILLCAVVWRMRSRLAHAVCAWWVAEELLVAGCAIGMMVSPWVVQPGDAQCSALARFDLGKIGLVVIILIAGQAVRAHRSGRR